MRVALLNEGTYPYETGGVSTWCDQLVRGLAEHEFHLVAIAATARNRERFERPANGATLQCVPVWDEARPPPRPRRHRAARAAALLCRGVVAPDGLGAASFAVALRELAAVAEGGYHPLAGVPLAGLLTDAWAAGCVEPARPITRFTLGDAATAATLIEHAVRPLGVQLSTVDLCHPVASGLAVLVALAAKWRSGTPYVLTEHGVYLRERYLGYIDQVSPGVRAVLLGFHAALARLAYAEAAMVAPVTAFNRRWEERAGADPDRIVVVPNGVDPARYPVLTGEPGAPSLVWVGRIDPLKDLLTLIEAFAGVHATRPATVLHLCGPVPVGNEEYASRCRAAVADHGLSTAVDWVGPVPSSRDGFARGQVAVLSSISEGMPYTVVEAMMCGRATVSTDVGGVAETVDDTGLVVPARDPAALAEACLRLLGDADLRRTCAHRGRERAERLYTLDRCLGAYRALYDDVRAARRPELVPAA